MSKFLAPTIYSRNIKIKAISYKQWVWGAINRPCHGLHDLLPYVTYVALLLKASSNHPALSTHLSERVTRSAIMEMISIHAVLLHRNWYDESWCIYIYIYYCIYIYYNICIVLYSGEHSVGFQCRFQIHQWQDIFQMETCPCQQSWVGLKLLFWKSLSGCENNSILSSGQRYKPASTTSVCTSNLQLWCSKLPQENHPMSTLSSDASPWRQLSGWMMKSDPARCGDSSCLWSTNAVDNFARVCTVITCNYNQYLTSKSVE